MRDTHDDGRDPDAPLAGLGALAPFLAATFPLGQLLATTNALRRLSMDDITGGLARHGRRDWGEVCEEDNAANDAALQDGARLLSAYRAKSGERFWIITEADRSATTVLLPEDY